MRKFAMHDTKFPMIIILNLILLSCILLSGNALAYMTIKVNHDHIKIDTFYHGSAVTVRGVSDPGTDLVIKITSPECSQDLRKKGKVAGILWMNTGELKFENVPNLYFLGSTGKFENILSPDEVDKYLIGYSPLKGHTEIKSVVSKSLPPESLSGDEKTRWFNEFVKLKEASRLYFISSEKISITMADGRQQYFIKFDWPYEAPAGNYMVTAYAVKDKKVVEEAEGNVLVEQVGVVKALANMAEKKGALYGMMSIIVALGAGFGVGIIFRKGGGAH